MPGFIKRNKNTKNVITIDFFILEIDNRMNKIQINPKITIYIIGNNRLKMIL